jgi:hypothetical protein
MRIHDPGWRQFGFGIRMEKSRIRDKNPGSATLSNLILNFGKFAFQKKCKIMPLMSQSFNHKVDRVLSFFSSRRNWYSPNSVEVHLYILLLRGFNNFVNMCAGFRIRIRINWRCGIRIRFLISDPGLGWKNDPQKLKRKSNTQLYTVTVHMIPVPII